MKTCEDCGKEFAPVYQAKQTRRCRVCQVLSLLIFHGETERACWLCDEPFAPLANKHSVCCRCQTFTNKHTVAGKCGFCKQQRDDLLGKDVRVCSECASNPVNRQKLAKALNKKRKA